MPSTSSCAAARRREQRDAVAVDHEARVDGRAARDPRASAAGGGRSHAGSSLTSICRPAVWKRSALRSVWRRIVTRAGPSRTREALTIRACCPGASRSRPPLSSPAGGDPSAAAPGRGARALRRRELSAPRSTAVPSTAGRVTTAEAATTHPASRGRRPSTASSSSANAATRTALEREAERHVSAADAQMGEHALQRAGLVGERERLVDERPGAEPRGRDGDASSPRRRRRSAPWLAPPPRAPHACGRRRSVRPPTSIPATVVPTGNASRSRTRSQPATATRSARTMRSAEGQSADGTAPVRRAAAAELTPASAVARAR